MTADELRDIISADLACEHIALEGDGRHWYATIVSAEFDGLRGQERGAEFGQGGVLGAGDEDFATEHAPAANEKLVHQKIQRNRRRGPGIGSNRSPCVAPARCQRGAAAHSVGVKVFIDSACTSSVCIFAPSVR